MCERLSLAKIIEKYPDQWVGLDDIEWASETSSNIISAVVRYTDKTKSELTEMQFETDGKIVAFYTTPDHILSVGAFMI